MARKVKQTPESKEADRVVQSCLFQTQAQINVMDLGKLSKAALDAHRDGRDMKEAVLETIGKLRTDLLRAAIP